MESKRDLWLRIKNYDFQQLVLAHLVDHVQAAFGGPNASTRAFADKLARKLGWSSHFALEAIEEYKKFVYLGQVADFPVTPPKVIDQVWHEHLLFTRGYREFCATVLEHDFDHHPELVPLDDQTATFQAQYAATRELYRKEFNREPPANFWGVPKFANRPEPVMAGKPLRKREDARHGASGDAPLYVYFGAGGSAGDGGHQEFGGGKGEDGGSLSDPGSLGGHDGAGADSTGTGDGGGHGDSSGGDGGSGGGDGSGCSSGCGGGCGGGG